MAELLGGHGSWALFSSRLTTVHHEAKTAPSRFIPGLNPRLIPVKISSRIVIGGERRLHPAPLKQVKNGSLDVEKCHRFDLRIVNKVSYEQSGPGRLTWGNSQVGEKRDRKDRLVAARRNGTESDGK